jgi:serine/threonine protein kinase
VPQILRDVLAGMAALHSLNIVHRDMKSHNVLIDYNAPGQIFAKVVAPLPTCMMVRSTRH